MRGPALDFGPASGARPAMRGSGRVAQAGKCRRRRVKCAVTTQDPMPTLHDWAIAGVGVEHLYATSATDTASSKPSPGLDVTLPHGWGNFIPQKLSEKCHQAPLLVCCSLARFVSFCPLDHITPLRTRAASPWSACSGLIY